MQTHGHVFINSQKVLVLVRQMRHGRAFKLRTTGKDGNHFSDETLALEAFTDKSAALLRGEVVYL